ncbi:DNA binding protein [Striga asiatica]|uniref:DNA binding protein n=1 Tax=Striga asiatica TaxID=4170 RepID=A0A5A7PNM7_STRAF|nr:DNA binding protein [Striga asiatica]
MVDKSKKRKKVTITEDNMSTLLRRYSVSTVLALLQEVSQAAGEKINWAEMVKNTTTGICSAREYQMLWRHLAYGETLDQIEPDSNPMDDDSDLEYELEAFPAAGREASVEAAACVKVLIASGCTNDSNLPNNSTVSTIEGPLTINIPNSKALSMPSDSSPFTSGRQGTNITIPVSLQKVPSSSGLSGEKRPGTEASGVNLPRRKRRGWSVEEDQKLTAAVKNIVEPNWALIASKDFNNDRKPSELSQRWANLKKKQANLKSGTTSLVPETQLAAAHRAMSLALDMPMGDNLKATSAGMKSQHQPRKSSVLPDQPLGRGGGSGPPKPQAPPKRPPTNPTPTPDSMVKAAAVAAGARIASASDASSLLEAARSQNVVHITTGGGPMMRSGPAGLSSQLPSNVHFIRNGLVKAPISTYSPAKPSVPRAVEHQHAQKEAAHRNQASQSAGSGNREVEKQVQSASNEGKDDGMAVVTSGKEDNGELKC